MAQRGDIKGKDINCKILYLVIYDSYWFCQLQGVKKTNNPASSHVQTLTMTDNEQDRPKSLLQQHQDKESRRKWDLRPVSVTFLGTEGVFRQVWGHGWHGKAYERLVNEKNPVLSWSYRGLLKVQMFFLPHLAKRLLCGVLRFGGIVLLVECRV